ERACQTGGLVVAGVRLGKLAEGGRFRGLLVGGDGGEPVAWPVVAHSLSVALLAGRQGEGILSGRAGVEQHFGVGEGGGLVCRAGDCSPGGPASIQVESVE